MYNLIQHSKETPIQIPSFDERKEKQALYVNVKLSKSKYSNAAVYHWRALGSKFYFKNVEIAIHPFQLDSTFCEAYIVFHIFNEQLLFFKKFFFFSSLSF